MIAIAAHRAPITDACASSLGRSDRAGSAEIVAPGTVTSRGRR